MFTEKDIVKYKELISQGKKPEEAKNIMRAEQNKILSTEQSFQTPNYLSSIQKKPIIDEKIQYNKRYFSDEKKIVDEMLKEGYSEDISRQTIEKRRKEILPLGKLKTDEATFLIKMADAGITSEQAVQGLNEYRNEGKKKQWDNMNIAQKAGKTYFDFVLGTLGGGVGEVGGIVDFATRGNSELGKMGMEGRTVAREINKGSIAGTTGDILGSGIIDYGLGKTLGTVGGIGNKFNKLKPVNQIIGGGAGFGALTAIGEKGSKATVEDIATSASIGAGAGLVLGKVIVPAASKVAQKGIKYGTALQKGGTEGLTKSISRDLKKPVGIVKESIQGTADRLSTNINRMTKGEIQKFEKSHKVSVGKFLNDRGISESGDDLLEKLSENLKLSRKEANKGLEKIQGNFKAPKQQIATDIIDETTGKYKVIESDPVETMLKDNLINSSNKGLSKDSLRAKELLEKYQKDGLSMPEINEGKRWFQANNKFSYLTDDTSSRKGFVTGLDNAVREWQFDTAKKMGFGNLREINKQTKAYYELLEGITKWNEGSKGNLPIGLTDWLAFNADPAVFLAKQITQSGKVKKGVIKFLNLGRKTQPEVTPALFSKKVKNVNNIRNSTNSPALESIQGGNLKPNQPTNVSNKPISDNKTKMSEPIIKKRRELTKEQINQLKEKLKPAVDKTKEDLVKSQQKIDMQDALYKVLNTKEYDKINLPKKDIVNINDYWKAHDNFMYGQGKKLPTVRVKELIDEDLKISLGDTIKLYARGTEGKMVTGKIEDIIVNNWDDFVVKIKDVNGKIYYTEPRLLSNIEEIKPKSNFKKLLPSNFKEKAQDLVDKVAEKTGVKTNLLPTNSKQVSKVSDDLISEARKYKSADEFINKNGINSNLRTNNQGEISGGTIKYKDGELKFSIEREDGDNYMIIDIVDSGKIKRQGIGTNLMKEAENIAKKEGLDRIELGAYPQDNTIKSQDLKTFYEKLGYDIKDEFEMELGTYYDMYKTPYGQETINNKLKQIYEQANEPKLLAKKDGGKAMSVSDDLISEARKYKSAESFGNKLFDDNKLVSHGTNGDFKLSDYKTNTLGYYGKGFYVGTESKARGYGKNLKSFEFKKTPKFFTDFNSKSDLENIALKFMSKDTNIDYATRYLNAWENFQKNLQKKGYDGIDSGFDEKLIFNPEKILKEVDYNAKQIYEQANKPKLLRPAKTEDVANKNKLLQK